jgi:hypothetical protein
VGPEAEAAARAVPEGGVLLLENLRFHPEEEANDPAFAARLAALGECYVNDAFGTAHRAHASTEGVAHLLHPAVAGFLMQKELDYLGRALEQPRRPFVAILGGAKISGKIDVITALFEKVDRLLIGGAMMFTSQGAGGPAGGPLAGRADRVELAGELLARAAARHRAGAAGGLHRLERGRIGAGDRHRDRAAPRTRWRISPASVALFARSSPMRRPCCGTARWASQSVYSPPASARCGAGVRRGHRTRGRTWWAAVTRWRRCSGPTTESSRTSRPAAERRSNFSR